MTMSASNDSPAREPGKPETRIAVAMGVLVALVGLAGFAGWLAYGDTLFWSMLQAGLAWCI